MRPFSQTILVLILAVLIGLVPLPIPWVRSFPTASTAIVCSHSPQEGDFLHHPCCENWASLETEDISCDAQTHEDLQESQEEFDGISDMLSQAQNNENGTSIETDVPTLPLEAKNNNQTESNGSQPLAPAFLIIGDSTVDCGNNNFLGTFARANIPPYGRDFDTHMPTGRFCNGRLTVDYLALFMGLPFVPTFLGLGGVVQNMLQGVNFASAGAGVLHPSGFDLGQHISLTQQIQQVSDIFQEMTLFMGEDSTKELISKSIVYISIASNDYIHFYLRNISGIRTLQAPWEFNRVLVETISNELMHLHDVNVRKMAVLGMGPLGCAPRFLFEGNSENGECIQDINNMIIEYNFALRYAVESLNTKLPEAHIVFCDIYEGIMDIIRHPQLYGLESVNEACCGAGKYGGLLMCLTSDLACQNASTYVWWDEFHPTATVNSIMADNLWLSKHLDVCQPMNLHDLVMAGS